MFFLNRNFVHGVYWTIDEKYFKILNKPLKTQNLQTFKSIFFSLVLKHS